MRGVVDADSASLLLITASSGGDVSDAIQQSEIVSRGNRENAGPEARRVGML